MGVGWTDRGVEVNGTQFQLAETLHDLFSLKDVDGLVLGKTRKMVEDYLDLFSNFTASRVFELGIFRGGSTAFFNELLRPEKLVAIDIMEKPKKVFRSYLESGPNAGSVRPYFRIDQANSQELTTIYSDEFGEQPIDLVIDDASHFLRETRASFNCLFPKLRPGGLYIIEDWTWAHVYDPSGGLKNHFGTQPALSNLIFEIMLAAAFQPRLIPEIRIFFGSVVVRKGEQPAEENFDVSKLCFHHGEPVGGIDFFERLPGIPGESLDPRSIPGEPIA